MSLAKTSPIKSSDVPQNLSDAEGIPTTSKQTNKHRFRTVTLQQLAREDIPSREHLLSPILQEGGLAMIVAQRGVGKTHVAVAMAYAVATGTKFLNWTAPKPKRVFYIDGEMPQKLLQQRILQLMAGNEAEPPDESYFKFLPMDRQELGVSVNLALEDHQEDLEVHLSEADLIVLDNISTLVSSGAENEASSWDAMQRWLLGLRRRGKCVLLVHHAGRSDQSRGTSKREDVLDTLIKLKRPDGYIASEGARFEVYLDKARNIFGDDAEPFEARLTVEDSRNVWRVSRIVDGDEEEVVRLAREGKSIREIGEQLKLSKSKVGRMTKDLKEAGRIA